MTKRHLKLAECIDAERGDGLIASASRVFEYGSVGLAELLVAINNGQRKSFIAAVELLRLATGRVVVTGMGKSGHIGRKIAATFASTGTPAFFVHAAEAGHGDLGMIGVEDVILALSWSGESAELKSLIDYSRRFRIPLIAMTAATESGLGKAADIVLELPRVREACPHNLAPTTSTLLQLVLGDALAVALLESRGFSAKDFRVFHPAGRLGALLKFVRDFMFVGERVPLISTGSPMSDVIVEISAKGIGCVGVVDGSGHLIGIVTDGDLRRHMQPTLLNLPVDEVMTCNPKTISPDHLATEALQYMNASKVHVLFVTDQAKPIGILHLHEILRAGVA